MLCQCLPCTCTQLEGRLQQEWQKLAEAPDGSLRYRAFRWAALAGWLAGRIARCVRLGGRCRAWH